MPDRPAEDGLNKTSWSVIRIQPEISPDYSSTDAEHPSIAVRGNPQPLRCSLRLDDLPGAMTVRARPEGIVPGKGYVYNRWSKLQCELLLIVLELGLAVFFFFFFFLLILVIVILVFT